MLDFLIEETAQVNLSEADIIVSGGRAMGGPENFKIIRDLAEVLGAAVGSSRACVDAGWIPYSHQVGQTGRTVCPKVYIACGISGRSSTSSACNRPRRLSPSTAIPKRRS